MVWEKKVEKKEKYFQRIINKKTEGINKKSSTGKHPKSLYFSLPFALKFFFKAFYPRDSLSLVELGAVTIRIETPCQFLGNRLNMLNVSKLG